MNNLPIESLHFSSERDPGFVASVEHKCFDYPQRILHNQGHMPPTFLEVEKVQKFNDFIIRQYWRKFGISINIKHNYFIDNNLRAKL